MQLVVLLDIRRGFLTSRAQFRPGDAPHRSISNAWTERADAMASTLLPFALLNRAAFRMT